MNKNVFNIFRISLRSLGFHVIFNNLILAFKWTNFFYVSLRSWVNVLSVPSKHLQY